MTNEEKLLEQIHDNVTSIAVMKQEIKDHVQACEKSNASIHKRVNFSITLSLLMLAAIIGQYFVK